MIRIRFEQLGDFAALNAAQAWCKANGVSYGSSQRGAPTALMWGDYDISKWRNLSNAEIAKTHGRMTGDFRNGAVTIVICDKPAA